MASVSISNLSKNLGGNAILRNISLEVEDGAFVVLVGPSGCGKSTLLRTIAGLEDASQGEIHIGGQEVTMVAPKDRDIAMVFQSYALYPHMTVRENMGFSLRLAGESPVAIAAAVDRVADILGLRPLLARKPRELSGGQRQRVAMGRAIVRNPKAFLFDEPLSNLDAKLRVKMRTEIKALHQRLQTTMIYVTHDQIEAMTLADKIVVMRDGRIEQAGAPITLYDCPANVFVAGFIGSPAMNFLSGRIDQSRFVTASNVPLPLAGTVPMAGAVSYGIRPEHFALEPEGLPFRVEVVEPLGSETQLFGSLAGERVSILLRQRLVVKAGDTIPVRPEVEHVHLFDETTGNRLN
ncbi:ABC transporter ATP-binding protein [Ferrovibrio sp.]|uniref:ABC transporter ATP-binding protein n=1 Tax=Ferrovibrio sp. TaxID=1917215 RepID=UPI003D13B0E2